MFQALLSKGSMLDASMVGGTAEVVVVDVVVATSGFGAGGAGDERLNAELSSSWGEVTVGFGGGADDIGGGGERPTRSFAKDGGLCGFAVGDAKFEKLWPKPFDEMDGCRDWGLGGAGAVGEVKLSNKLPPLADAVGDEIFGSAGGDFLVAKLVKLSNGDGFSAGLGGGEVVDGKLRPLNASVNPPMLDDGCGGGDAISPNEGLRSCCGGAAGAGGGFA